jgi:murein L,D-transpeptidase YafK
MMPPDIVRLGACQRQSSLSEVRKKSEMGRAQAVSALTCALVLLFAAFASAAEKANAVLVVKSERQLYLMKGDKVLATYPVALGAEPQGHKQEQGDERTPEGRYVLDSKNVNSKFYKSIHISYPNAQDRENARKRGVSPGGDIMIHGMPNGWDWTWPILQLASWTDGCIALRDRTWIRSGWPWMWDTYRDQTPSHLKIHRHPMALQPSPKSHILPCMLRFQSAYCPRV